MNQSETTGSLNRVTRLSTLDARPVPKFLQSPTLRFPDFQKQDLARGAMHNGLVASLDTGLGKSIYGYTWALLKSGWTVVADPSGKKWIQPNAAILLIVPGDLHAQMIREGEQKLHVQTRVISSQADFEALVAGPDGLPRLDAAGRPILPPGFYITSYTQLTTNNVTRQQDPEDCPKPRAMLQQWGLKERGPGRWEPDADKCPEHFETVDHLFANRRHFWRDEFDTLQLNGSESQTELDKHLTKLLAACANWIDEVAQAKRQRDLHAAHQVLQNLFTLRPNPMYADLTLAQQDFVIRAFLGERFADYARNPGEFLDYPIGAPPPGYIPGKPETDTRPKWRVKCVYDPALCDLSYNAFDCIILDEGVKMKGTDTYVGRGVRGMVARNRCVLTATPIKNRLPDIFWLAWWAAGGREEAHARFPYRNDMTERDEFARTFLVSEHNLTKEEAARESRRPRRYVKLTAEICNVHRLWKFLAPLVLRRRKDECGEEIVPRERKVVRVKMGTMQQRVYRYHMEAEYLDCNDEKAMGAQLQALRTAAADHTSSCLINKGEVIIENPCTCPAKTRKQCPHCRGTGKVKDRLPHRSSNVYTPKFAAVLTLIHEIIARNEQVLVGTVFNESHDHLGQLLRDASVPFFLADGRTPPLKRGPLMQRFRGGEVPVCLGGLESVANGHNLDTVNNVIIYAYSWAYDLIKQFLDRVWRLTSRRKVNLYVVLCDSTIDGRLEALNWEKTDSIELALDGRLIGEHTEEISLAQLLNIAREEFDAKAETIDEAVLQRDWPALRANLARVMQTWSPDIPAELRTKTAPLNPNRNLNRITLNQRLTLPTSNSKLPDPKCDYRSKMKALADALRALPPARSTDVWDNL